MTAQEKKLAAQEISNGCAGKKNSCAGNFQWLRREKLIFLKSAKNKKKGTQRLTGHSSLRGTFCFLQTACRV
jgi:hypothetical protein